MASAEGVSCSGRQVRANVARARARVCVRGLQTPELAGGLVTSYQSVIKSRRVTSPIADA